MKRGDIVRVNWPYSDLKGSKDRPAVVVQADFLNGLIDDTILVQITGTPHAIPKTEVQIDPAQETGSGLKKICYVNCLNSLTRDQTIIGRVSGYLSDAVMQQVEACLKVVLELR
jgi:mRNA-degrading endonuclease toxin of MazEF toxin-antitoxin module